MNASCLQLWSINFRQPVPFSWHNKKHNMKRQTETSTRTKPTKWTIQKILHNDITLRTVDRAADYSGVLST